MSNNPPSDVVARIQPSTLVFVVLVLIVGALLLATTGIDPQATVRASLSATPVPPTITPSLAPTINAYASVGYKPYTSPDNILKIEYPDQWTPVIDPSSPLTYVFSPGGSQNNSGAVVVIQVGSNADLVSGLSGATVNSTPREVLTLAFGAQAGQAPINVNDVKAGSYTGAGIHQTNPLRQGTPTSQERELWVLTIDPVHVAVIQATALPGEWTSKLQPIFLHMMNSISFDSAAITKAAGTAAATSAATSASTAAATQTVAVTSTVTSAATLAATTAPTSVATTLATMVSTPRATNAATMAATVVSTVAATQNSVVLPTMVPPLPTATNAAK